MRSSLSFLADINSTNAVELRGWKLCLILVYCVDMKLRAMDSFVQGIMEMGGRQESTDS